MRFQIVAQRRYGVAIDKKELCKMRPVIGDVHIIETHESFLGRTTATAWIFSAMPGDEHVLPRLIDVRVTGMAHNGMNLTGVEIIDEALYVQSWWCRPLHQQR